MKPIIILGGGLWGGLLAYRLQKVKPHIPYLLIEKNDTFGGEHTWSFHGPDLTPEALEWIRPFIDKSWEGYQVSFPKYTRSFESSYHSLTSTTFHRVLMESLPGERVRLSTTMTLEEAFKEGEFVIDARGLPVHEKTGFQKFLGLDVKLKTPHGFKLPLIKDARVLQKDGYRFIYYLPWSEERILIEDTRYTESPEMDLSAWENDLMSVIKNHGWSIDTVIRKEVGCLPIPLTLKNPSPSRPGLIDLCGIYHDTTGYSLPMAVRLIDEVVHLHHVDESHVRETVSHFRTTLSKQRKFFRILNLLLFKAAPPEERYLMLEFFYQHKAPLIERFYAGKLSSLDQLRFFLGKPPVRMGKAMKALIQGRHHEL